MAGGAVSHKPHPAQDIVAGSRWPCACGPGCAVVKAAAAGWVEFTFTDGAVVVREHLHHAAFRRRFVAPYDSRAVRSWFSMTMSNLQQAHLFWDPMGGKLYARTTRRSIEDAFIPSRGRGGAVPSGVLFVGTYTAPIDADSFFRDFHDVLAIANPIRYGDRHQTNAGAAAA